MGRRSLLTQKELDMLFKHPPVGFTVIGIIFLVLGCFILSLETAFGVLMIGGSIISIIIGIVLFIKGINKSTPTDSEDMMYDDRRELPPSYEVLSVAFDEKTRFCTVVFSESKQYRTVERYITRNYVKYPVLSAWKVKTKNITKSIKLTNSELEALQFNADFLIRKFAYELVKRIGIKDIFPSWYKEKTLRLNYDAAVENRNRELASIVAKINNVKARISQLVPKVENRKSELNNKIASYEKKKNDLIRLLERAKTMKPSVLLNILTLSIYNYLASDKRKSKLMDAINASDDKISILQDEIKKLDVEVSEERENLLRLEHEAEEYKKTAERANEEDYAQMMLQISVLVPLLTEIKITENRNDQSFLLLKEILGARYTKIVGCYIIKNNENGKCYVGQSKDVIKRIKQHFKGTEPHNIIFAEDYYSSLFEDRSELFSVKIIPTSVAELDETERDLIVEYDALTKGYNSTAGNKG